MHASTDRATDTTNLYLQEYTECRQYYALHYYKQTNSFVTSVANGNAIQGVDQTIEFAKAQIEKLVQLDKTRDSRHASRGKKDILC